MNLYGLLFAGVMIELGLGPPKTAGVYFAAGIGSSIAGVMLHPASVSVGASGAIFGLWGYLLVAMTIANFHRGPAMLPVVSFAAWVGLNLLIGAKKPDVNDAAHIAGLAIGAGIGSLSRVISKSKIQNRKSKMK